MASALRIPNTLNASVALFASNSVPSSIVNEIRPDKRYHGEAYDGEDALPVGPYAALDLFDAATEMHDILGAEFARVFSIVKRAEYDEFLQVISPWEREHLLLNV